jgi:hypothetical protein
MNDSNTRLIIVPPNTPLNVKVILDTPPHILFLIIPILATVTICSLFVLICIFLTSALIDSMCIFVSGPSFYLLIIILLLKKEGRSCRPCFTKAWRGRFLGEKNWEREVTVGKG